MVSVTQLPVTHVSRGVHAYKQNMQGKKETLVLNEGIESFYKGNSLKYRSS